MRSFFETMERCMRDRGLRYIDLAERTGFLPRDVLGSKAHAWRVTRSAVLVYGRVA